MKKICNIFFVFVLGTFFAGTPLMAEELTSIAERLVESMQKQDFATPVGLFDETMKKALPAEKLKDAWQSLEEKMGKLKLKGTERIQRIESFDVVFVKCQFAKGNLETKVVFNKEKKVAGLFFQPPQIHDMAKPPAYAISERFKEFEVVIGSEPWKLPGLLTIPVGSGSFPGLVLVHGSGPNDRDETIGPNKPFRDIAQGLASRGIAVLRYDKRTLTWKNKVIEQPLGFTVKEEVVDDAIAAVSLLQKTPGVNPKKIFVLGHSLGGMMIPRIGSADPRIAGFIIFAGANRPLEDMIVEQTSYLNSLKDQVSEEEKKELEELKTKANYIKALQPSLKTATGPWIIGALPGYWLDLRQHNPLELVQKMAKPLLIMQGERDYQVTMKDFDNWKKALALKPNAKFISYPMLNHLFMKGEGPCSPAEYRLPGNVSEGVIRDIAEFLLKP